ncbi:hypothetical protein EJB05_40446, partial [Eragrostis curvula]
MALCFIRCCHGALQPLPQQGRPSALAGPAVGSGSSNLAVVSVAPLREPDATVSSLGWLAASASDPGGPGPCGPDLPRSEGYVEIDSEENMFHGYRTPVPKGDALRVIRRGPECFICPVCPNKKPRKSMDDMEKHVVSLARPYNDKFSSRHRQVAWNHGWMPPLPQQQQ